MVYRLRLFFSLCCIISSMRVLALPADTSASSGCVLVGMAVNPFYLSKGYSASVSYRVEIGFKDNPIFPTIQFGLPNYELPITTSSGNTASYTIQGAYIQPGFTWYWRHPSTYNESYYIGFLAYFGSFNNQITLKVSDSNWGTTQKYSFIEKQYISGMGIQFGGIFNLYEKLKMNTSCTIGNILKSDNGKPKLNGFQNSSAFTPGLGYETKIFTLGVHLGLIYRLY